jgi:hypothetical protein
VPKQVGSTEEILRDILIVQLAQAGVPGGAIRKIVGCSMEKVTRIVKHLKPARPNG